jgi:hypothetical protein
MEGRGIRPLTVLVLFAALYVLGWCFDVIRFDHAVVLSGVLSRVVSAVLGTVV